jgi:uncharacterized Zn finger protein
METISALLRNMTLDDLREWAGVKIFSRGQTYIRHVKELSRLEDGTLAAWVSGSEVYATSVCLNDEGDFDYFCTCPYDWGPCKHAVAVVLSAAEQVKRKKEIPLLKNGDDLYYALFDESEDDYADEDDWPDEDEEPEFSSETIKGGRPGNPRLQKILTEMEKDKLITMILELTAHYPEIERGILEKEQLATGRVDKVVSSLRREIRTVTSEPAWYNSWKREGNIPDYSHVQAQLQALLASGHADAVIQLGDELWTRGNEQVEQSHDEGDTATAIGECLEVVLQAVPHSSMTPAEQLLWVIDRALADEYSLLDSGGKILESKKYTKAHWHEVAKDLETRLKSMAKPTSAVFSETYRRNKVVNMLLDAYERSGTPEKVIPLLEKEADICQCYGKLVDILLAAGEKEKGREWCIRGFERTLEHAPGIATELQNRLRQIAEKDKKYDLAATYLAEDFFERTSRKTFTDLRKAAEKAKVWPNVRACVLRYLEIGKRPEPAVGGKGTAWPLPKPEVMRPRNKATSRYERFPDLDTLIDIAILEERFDDVVALYKDLRKTKRWGWETDKTVAEAVANTHPQIAIDIWRAIVDSLIGQVKPKAYEEAAGYLRRMCKVFQEQNRTSDWQSLLSELRRKHKAKRRLMEVLDSLSGKKIID